MADMEEVGFMHLSIAVVEDDKKYRQTIIEYVGRYFSSIHAKAGVVPFSNAESFLESDYNGFDMIFMDIKLPGIDGLTAATRLRQTGCEAILIYITNMSHLAVKGYAVNALDFIVKPLIYQDFVVTLNRAVSIIKTRKKEEILTIKSNGKLFRVSTSKICYVEVLGHNVTYHLEDAVLETRGSLSSMEGALENAGFLRPGRSYMVNPLFIDAVCDNDIQIHGDIVPISKLQKKAFLAKFNKWISSGGR